MIPLKTPGTLTPGRLWLPRRLAKARRGDACVARATEKVEASHAPATAPWSLRRSGPTEPAGQGIASLLASPPASA
jgi:hypothetical protein